MSFLPKCSARPFAVVWTLIFSFLLGLAPSPAQAQSDTSPIDLGEAEPTPKPKFKNSEEEPELELGAYLGYCDYQPAIKVEIWYPLWIVIKPIRNDLKGVITCRQPDSSLVVTMPLEVAKGTTKRLLTYYKLSDGLMPTLEITVDAKPLKSREMLPLPLRYAKPEDHHVLVFGEQQGSFGFLKRRGNSNQDVLENSDLQIPETTVLEGRIEQIPSDPLGLSGIDSIILNTPEVRAISVEQWRAIEQWVEMGGRLLIGTGQLQPFLAQSVLKLPQGIMPGAPQPGLVAAGGPEMLISPLGGTWETIHARTPGQGPLLATRRMGAGLLSMAAVSLDSTNLPYFNSLPESWRLWPKLLHRDAAEAMTDGLDNAMEAYVPIALQLPFTVNLAGVGWVMAYLGLYILLALPLNWLFWITLKRREWAWPSMIVIALGFAYYGYHSGLESQAKGLHVHEFSVMRRAQGSASAYYESFSTVFADRRTRTPLTAVAGVFPSNIEAEDPMQFQRREQLYSSSPLEVHFGTSVDLDNFFIYAFSARNLRSEGVVVPQGSIEWGTGETLKNGLPWRFDRWRIVQGDVAHEGLQPLEAGGEVTVGAARTSVGETQTEMVNMALTDFRSSVALSGEQQMRLDQSGFGHTLANIPGVNIAKGLGTNYFIGIADAPLSPLLDNLKVARRMNRLVYVQEIAPKGEQVTQNAQVALRIMNREMDREGRIPATSKTIWFWARPTLLKAAPPLVPGSPLPQSLTLSLTIAHAPDSDRVFSHENLNYRVIGCGAQVFNFRTGELEPTGLLETEQITVSPLIDYLDPVDSTLQIWLDGSPQHLRLRQEPLEANHVPVMGSLLWSQNDIVNPLNPWTHNNNFPTRLEVVSYDFELAPQNADLDAGVTPQ